MRYDWAVYYRSLAFAGVVAGSVFATLGCAGSVPATQPSTYDRGQAALKDPFNYSPDIPNTDKDGDDQRDLGKDISNVLNP